MRSSCMHLIQYRTIQYSSAASSFRAIALRCNDGVRALPQLAVYWYCNERVGVRNLRNQSRRGTTVTLELDGKRQTSRLDRKV